MTQRTRANTGWLKALQILDARAKRRLEPGHRRELWVQAQELESRSGAVEQEQAITEAIREAFRIPRNQVGLNGGGDRIPIAAERTGYRCVDYHAYTSPWVAARGAETVRGRRSTARTRLRHRMCRHCLRHGAASQARSAGACSAGAFHGSVRGTRRWHCAIGLGTAAVCRIIARKWERPSHPRRGTSEDQRVSELDLRLEQVAAALRQMRQATGSLQDLETRLSVMTTECAQILNRWAQNDERHAAAVLELHGRLSEWNDIERRLLHESTTRMHQFERSVQHEWQALRAKQEEPLKRLDADAARVTETCLEAVDQALAGFARAESRLEAIEERLHREMGDLAREVRTALAEIGEQRPQVGERQPWSLDNVVRLHNELRAEPQGTVPGLALASSAGASTARALDRRPELPLIAAPAPADAVSRSSAGAAPFWRQRAAQALALAILVVGAGGLYLDSYVQAGVRDVASRAQAAERNAADARIAAGRELKAVRQHADERVASAEDSARRAQALGAILSASDLRRFDLIEGAAGSRAAQVLWSRSEGVAFSGPRLAAPPPGRIYQLWLTTPVTATSAGLVSVDSNGRANMTFAPPPVLPRPIVGASLTIEPIWGIHAANRHRLPPLRDSRHRPPRNAVTDRVLSDAIPVTAGPNDAVDTMLERICRSLGCVSLGQPDVGCSLWSSPHGIHLAVVFDETAAIQRVGEGGRLRDVMLARLEVRSRDDLTCLLVVPDARDWRALERAVLVRRAAEHLRVVTTAALTALVELVQSGALTRTAGTPGVAPGESIRRRSRRIDCHGRVRRYAGSGPAQSAAGPGVRHECRKRRLRQPLRIGVGRQQQASALDGVNELSRDRRPNGGTAPTAPEASEPLHAGAHVRRAVHDDRAFERTVIDARLEALETKRVAVAARRTCRQ